MTITVNICATLKDPSDKRFEAFLEDNLPNVRGFKGARSVELYLDDSTGRFCLHEVWQSQAHHQAYMAFIEEKGVLAKLAGFFSGPPEVTYYRKMDL